MTKICPYENGIPGNRTNGGRHECAFHILRHLGSTPEPSADILLDCGSAALAKIGRLAVRSISARTPLYARARTQMVRKTRRAAYASIGGALLTRPGQCQPSHAQSNVTHTQPQEIIYDQSETRSPHTAEHAGHLHRPPAADGVRGPVDRPPDAEEQRRGPRQGSEGVQNPDHHHHGHVAELRRLRLPRAP